eukprot:11472496-Karenia_brevis.AAC.1
MANPRFARHYPYRAVVRACLENGPPKRPVWMSLLAWATRHRPLMPLHASYILSATCESLARRCNPAVARQTV